MAEALGRRQETGIQLWAPPGELPTHVRPATTPEESAWLAALADKGGIAALLRRRSLASIGAALGLLIRLARVYRRERFDIAHVNWLQNTLPLWGTRQPLLVTVLGSDFGLLRLPGMVTLLRSLFRQRRTAICPNAEWMRPELEKHFGDVARIRPVPFGVHHRWFGVDRGHAQPGCWLAITRLTRQKVGDLFDWGERLFGEARKLHLFGPMQEEITLPSWVVWHGPTHPSELLDNWFPKATGLITLSRHDEGRPQVMLEAMAAGLPVVASDLPAHRDFVRHGETGMLVGNADVLRPALEELEDMGRNQAIGEAGRQWIKQTVGDWDDCAGRYVDLYHELCDDE